MDPSARKPETMAAVSGINGLHNLHVLVVEDEFLIRWSVSETLTRAGCMVSEAADGATALQVLSNSLCPVDAVILDYRLPDSNDLTLLARIRELSPRSVVLMMTAFGTDAVIERALALGVYRVINKPFEIHDLEGLLLDACSARP